MVFSKTPAELRCFKRRHPAIDNIKIKYLIDSSLTEQINNDNKQTFVFSACFLDACKDALSAHPGVRQREPQATTHVK